MAKDAKDNNTVDILSEDDVVFEPTTVNVDEELLVTDVQEAEEDVKKMLDIVDGNLDDDGATPRTPTGNIIKRLKDIEKGAIAQKSVSDGSTADYYELPEGATELQHLISYKNMNAQMGEIFRANYRYGQVSHSEKLRDAKKIKYYIEAEIERLEKYGE